MVPVDLDPAPSRLVWTSSTGLSPPAPRVVLIAHLLGGRQDLAPGQLCGRHGLLLIEDCAQSFLGVGDTGAPGADASPLQLRSDQDGLHDRSSSLTDRRRGSTTPSTAGLARVFRTEQGVALLDAGRHERLRRGGMR